MKLNLILLVALLGYPINSIFGIELNHQKNLSAIKKWGPSVISETNGPIYYKSKVLPWSSSWLPFSNMSLFLGDDSTNAKYDQFAKTIGHNSKAQETERQMFFNEQRHIPGLWPSYAGHCLGRSIASCIYQGPFGDYHDENNDFVVEIGHLQDMLTESCDYIPNIKIYGDLNEEGSDLNNIYPHEFHRIIEEMLIKRGQPVIINFDSNPKVRWFVPIYEVQMNATFKRKQGDLYTEYDEESGQVLHAMNVHLKVTWADFKDESNDGQYELETIPYIKDYYYVLLGEKIGEKIKVLKGRWNMSSVNDHPDCAVMIPSVEDMKRRICSNDEIKAVVVDELYKRALEQYNPEVYLDIEENSNDETDRDDEWQQESEDEEDVLAAEQEEILDHSKEEVQELEQKDEDSNEILEVPKDYSGSMDDFNMVLKDEDINFLRDYLKKYANKLDFNEAIIEQIIEQYPNKFTLVASYYLSRLNDQLTELRQKYNQTRRRHRLQRKTLKNQMIQVQKIINKYSTKI